MLCNECKKNEANVHIITEVNGRRVEEHLCSECAAKLNKINTDNIFAGFFGLSPMRKMFSLMSGGDVSDMAREFFGVQPEKSEQPKELDEIAKRRALIAEAIKEERYEDAAVLRDEIKKLNAQKEHIDELKAKLDEAIKEERYEDAAVIRDEIKGLLSKNDDEKDE